MTNPFQGRALGARSAGPQFPQRRAVRRKKGGKIPGYFLGGLFSGSPATSSTESHSSTDFNVTDPDYNALKTSTLQKGLSLSNTPYQPYTGEGVAPLSADQNTAFGNVRSGQGNYQPFYNQAASSVDKISGLDPASAGLPYVGQAAGMQTGTQAASPFVNAASQTLPGNVANYMSPYTSAVTDRIAQLGNQNLTEKVLPAVNDTFTGGDAAQFGREQHANITDRAIRDNQNTILGQQANALESGYSQASTAFNNDASRQATLAGTTGVLAQNDATNRAAFGTTAGNLTNQGVTAGNTAATAATNLGSATQNAGLTDANALSASGAQQQTQQQNQDTYNYNQFQQKINDPFAKASYGQGISQGWTLPTNTSTNSNSSSTSTPAQGSPFGQIIGGGISALGAAGGIPGLNQLGSLFGGQNVGAGSGTTYAQGGMVDAYAQGGMVPSITAMRKAFTPPVPPQGPMAGGLSQQGAMPTGMPGMPPMPTLAPQRPGGQPNGQPGSPFARGGAVGYAEGGEIPSSRWANLAEALFGAPTLESAVDRGDMGSPNWTQSERGYRRPFGPDFGAAPAAPGGLDNRDLMRQLRALLGGR